jgi:hypothetical protein
LRIVHEDDDQGEKKETVQISDAMFVGQKNYLKAWVFVHELGSNDDSSEPPQLPNLWTFSTPPPLAHESNPNSGDGDNDSPYEDDDSSYAGSDDENRSKRPRQVFMKDGRRNQRRHPETAAMMIPPKVLSQPK